MPKGIWVTPNKYIEFEDKPEVSGLNREIASRQAAWDFSGFIGLLPDPDPVLLKLGDGVEILESLTADGHLMSVIQTRKLGTLIKEYRWEPGSLHGEEPSAQAKKLRDDLVKDLARINLYDLISNLLDAPLYGFTPIELMWEGVKGNLHLTGLRALPCRWFGFDDKNDPKFISVNNPWDGEALPFGKFVITRHFPSYDNPYGLRLLSRCFWPITFKRGGIKFWVTFAEKYGMPFLLGKYAAGTDSDKQKEMMNNLASMVQDAIGIVPQGASVEMLERKGAAAGTVYERLTAAMDSENSKVIVGQTLTSDTSKNGGAYSQSKTHENVLKQYQQGDQKLVKTSMEEIAWLYGQVNAPGVPTPTFTWFEEADPKKETAVRDKDLTETGVKFTKSYYQRTYGLQEDDFELVEPKQETSGKGSEFAEAGKISGEQQAIDALVEKITPLGVKALAANEAAILEIIKTSASYEEAFERLLEAYPSLDTRKLQNALERGLVNAEIYGRYTATP